MYIVLAIREYIYIYILFFNWLTNITICYTSSVGILTSVIFVSMFFHFGQNLGDMAMAELGEGCPLLKEIVLSHCRQITDVGLTHLVKNCRMLESCHVVYCPGITAAGVATVVSSCPNIKKVLVEKWKVSERTKRRAGTVISYLCVDL